jgi:hypothetical protein
MLKVNLNKSSKKYIGRIKAWPALSDRRVAKDIFTVAC